MQSQIRQLSGIRDFILPSQISQLSGMRLGERRGEEEGEEEGGRRKEGEGKTGARALQI